MKKVPAIQFRASLEGSGCIKVDGDGAGAIRFAVPASELEAYSKLTAFREQELIVTVVKA